MPDISACSMSGRPDSIAQNLGSPRLFRVLFGLLTMPILIIAQLTAASTRGFHHSVGGTWPAAKRPLQNLSIDGHIGADNRE